MFSVDSGLSTDSTAEWTGSESFADRSEEPEPAHEKESDQVTAKDMVKRRLKVDKGVNLKQMFVRNKLRSFNENSKA